MSKDLGCKSYKPGDVGFDELAAKITPLHKIRHPFKKEIGCWANEDHRPNLLHRRNETSSKI